MKEELLDKVVWEPDRLAGELMRLEDDWMADKLLEGDGKEWEIGLEGD